MLLECSGVLEVQPDRDAEHRRQHQRKPRNRKWQVRDIHAIESIDHVGNAHDQGDHREFLHDVIHVVGNDIREAVHGPAVELGIVAAHLHRLAELDDHVFQQIRILCVVWYELAPHDAVQGQFIRLQGRGKIHQAFVQLQHMQQFPVLHGFVETRFGLV